MTIIVLLFQILKQTNGLEDDEAIIRSRVARSSEILQSFNDEVKEKMNAVMSMALEAASRKYGKSSSRADGQQGKVLSIAVRSLSLYL